MGIKVSVEPFIKKTDNCHRLLRAAIWSFSRHSFDSCLKMHWDGIDHTRRAVYIKRTLLNADNSHQVFQSTFPEIDKLNVFDLVSKQIT